jgi:hypothetical protein
MPYANKKVNDMKTPRLQIEEYPLLARRSVVGYFLVTDT